MTIEYAIIRCFQVLMSWSKTRGASGSCSSDHPFIWYPLRKDVTSCQNNNVPVSNVHGANMGLICGRQDPGGPHVGPMNLAIWERYTNGPFVIDQTPLLRLHSKSQFAGTLQVLTFKSHYNLMNYHFDYFTKFLNQILATQNCVNMRHKKIHWKDNIVTNDLNLRNIYLYACHVNNTGML